MDLDLFAGICVRDYAAALEWYGRLFGTEPTFHAHDAEAVWELAEHRYVYVEGNAERAGRSEVTLFVGDLDAVVDGITERGIEPESRETYDNGVRKVTYRDADGNEVGFGGAPLADQGAPGSGVGSTD